MIVYSNQLSRSFDCIYYIGREDLLLLSEKCMVGLSPLLVGEGFLGYHWSKHLRRPRQEDEMW